MGRIFESLSFILGPAAAVMNRLRFGPKFVIIGVLFIAPLFYVAYAGYETNDYQRNFNYKEHIGVEYIDPARDFLYALERHRLLSVAVLSGDTNFRSELSVAAGEVKAKMAEVDPMDAKYGGDDPTPVNSDLKTSARWKEIKAAWAKLEGGGFMSPQESEQRHAEITALTADLILNLAGNYSNLILDPDLDSYWLMDAYLAKMPAFAENVTKAATLALRPAGEGMAAADRTIELAGLVKSIQVMAGDFVAINLKTIYDNNKSGQVKANLDTTAVKAIEQLNSFAEFIKRNYLLSAAGNSNRAIAHQVVVDTLATLNQAYLLYAKVSPELDNLIMVRVRNYEGKRDLGVTATFLAALALIYLFLAFYNSMQRSVAALGNFTRRIISGTSERFALPNKDELGQIAQDYNQINAAVVEARTLQKKVEADNRELQDNIMSLLETVAQASDGDLTVRAKITAGALGNVADAFNQHLEAMGGLVGRINNQLESTRQAITNISRSSSQMAQGASHQAREIQNATELVEKMSTDIRKVSENAANAATASKRTLESAEDGAEAVQDVIGGMEALRANVQAGAKKMKNLGDRSMEITGIVGTINRISEQTNMLALNAAIEAARAGEQGRGFSVVAEEVRKLAERTAAATVEIDKLIKTIHLETNETVHAIEQQTQVVEQEAQVVGKAGESLTKIRDVSEESASLVDNINQVAQAQVEGTRSVVATMAQINAIAQATQQGAEGTANTIKELIALSDQLAKSIQRFKLR
jgi:methyl-accepting chemotaxis protein